MKNIVTLLVVLVASHAIHEAACSSTRDLQWGALGDAVSSVTDTVGDAFGAVKDHVGGAVGKVADHIVDKGADIISDLGIDNDCVGDGFLDKACQALGGADAVNGKISAGVAGGITKVGTSLLG